MKEITWDYIDKACEHNLSDASINLMNVCIGTEIKCINGNKFSCGPSNGKILSM